MLIALLLAAAPAFDVHALGVLGGDDDSNLSAYAIGTPQHPSQLLIDAGGFTRGLNADSEQTRAAALTGFFRGLSAVLITHSHLDHVGGLVVTSPVLFSAGRKDPLPIVALPQTIDALKAHAFAAPLWIDLPVVKPTELPPGKPTRLGDFDVETIPLEHPVPSAAFLVSTKDAAYLHLGDTGPSEAVWKRAKPVLAAGKLRAVSIEVSFPSKDEALALKSGHLTPNLLVRELAKLTGVNAGRGTDQVTIVKAIAAALHGCKVLVIHIKALQYDAVVDELKTLQDAGLPLVIPKQGGVYAF